MATCVPPLLCQAGQQNVARFNRTSVFIKGEGVQEEQGRPCVKCRSPSCPMPVTSGAVWLRCGLVTGLSFGNRPAGRSSLGLCSLLPRKDGQWQAFCELQVAVLCVTVCTGIMHTQLHLHTQSSLSVLFWDHLLAVVQPSSHLADLKILCFFLCSLEIHGDSSSDKILSSGEAAAPSSGLRQTGLCMV